jgi:hypothetical protein
MHIIVLVPSTWRHASRSDGSLLSTCLDEINDTTVLRLGQTSINTRRKISCPRQTKTVTKNHRQITHFSNKFNSLTNWHLENWVTVNSALTLADMIQGFRVLWPLEYLRYLVGAGGAKEAVFTTDTDENQAVLVEMWFNVFHTHSLYIHSFGIIVATVGSAIGKATCIVLNFL